MTYVYWNDVTGAVYHGQTGVHEPLTQVCDVLLVLRAQTPTLVALEHLYGGARAVEDGGRK